jgi:hypothetical protein
MEKGMMSKVVRISALLAPIVVGVLSGCTVVVDPDGQSKSPRVSAPLSTPDISTPSILNPADAPGEIREKAFVNTLQKQGFPNPEGAVELGKAACEVLRGGTSFDELVDITVLEGMSRSKAEYFLEISIVSFCPKFIR